MFLSIKKFLCLSLAPCLLFFECAGARKYFSQRQHIRALLDPEFYFAGNCDFKENENVKIFEGFFEGLSSSIKGSLWSFSLRLKDLKENKCQLNLNLPLKITPFFDNIKKIKILWISGKNKDEKESILIKDEKERVVFIIDTNLKIDKQKTGLPVEIFGDEKKIYEEVGRQKDYCLVTITHYGINVQIGEKKFILSPGESLFFQTENENYMLINIDNRKVSSSECANISHSHIVYIIFRIREASIY